MATDQLILGGLTFDDFSTPSTIPFGGRQANVVHKLPGGGRVIDVLGPDEQDITWSGIFWGDGAYQNGLALNGLRQSGAVLPLIFAGQFYMVVIAEAHLDIRRLPLFVSYQIACIIVQNPMAGNLNPTTSSIDSLVSADLATALSLAGL